MSKVAMAVGAHPDDIDIMMAGTLIQLGDAGYELHYMNIANGSMGSATLRPEVIARVRLDEARDAAKSIGATFHEPYVNDLEIFYTQPLIRKLCAVVREVQPEILLLPSPQDYMEDHMNASRVMVSAAFYRNMPNFDTDLQVPVATNDMAVYHALPYGLNDQLRNLIIPDFFVDIALVLARKREMLACHKSQKEWLDQSQGLDNYLNTMEEMSAEVGQMSGEFAYAEGWRRHSHLGFASEDFDPLMETLADVIS